MPLVPDDVNAVFDEIIDFDPRIEALEALKTGTVILSPLLSTDDLAGGSGTATVHTRTSYGWQFVASPVAVYYAIPFLAEGDLVTGIALTLNKRTSSAYTVTADLVNISRSGEAASGHAFSENANSPGLLAFSGAFSVAVAAQQTYYVKITPGNSVTPAADDIGDVRVMFRRGG